MVFESYRHQSEQLKAAENVGALERAANGIGDNPTEECCVNKNNNKTI